QVRQRTYLDGIFDFDKRMAAKVTEDVRQLAETLLQEAQQGQENTPAQKYVLLLMAREAAIRIGDAKLLAGSIAATAERFVVDAAVLQYEAALAMTKNGQIGCKAIDLVKLFVEAGLACAQTSPKTAQFALTEAQQQCDRCAGTRDVHLQAQKEVARLRDAIAAAKVAGERAGSGEIVPQVEVPPDSDPERLKARSALKQEHGDLDKKTKRDLELLQKKAMEQGLATRKNGPGARYEHLVAARDLAARCGDTSALLRAVTETATQFKIDVAATLLVGARDAVKRAFAPAQDLARLLLTVARQYFDRDLAIARQALAEAMVQCERTRGSTQLYKELLAEHKQVEADLATAAELAKLRGAAAANPADKRAAEQYGWFLCVRLERWRDGLQWLANGETQQLVLGTFANTIAKKELQATVSDDTAFEIAEAWWAYAESKDSRPEDRPALRRHAREWYGKLTHLKDVRRHRIAKCLEPDAPAAEPATPAAPTTAPKDEKPPPRPPAAAGKDPAGAAAIDAALVWLVKHQDEDGKWDCDQFMKHDDAASEVCDGAGNGVHDVGASGLALLAFRASGHTSTDGPHAQVVQRGLQWLAAQQNPEGRFGTNASHDFIYSHAIGTLAMARFAKAEPGQPWTGKATAGLGYLVQHRNPGAAWRYQPHDGDNDLSVTTWCVAACKACGEVGIELGAEPWRRVEDYVSALSDPSGMHGYSKSSEPSSRKPGDHQMRFPPERGAAMTAAGLYCRQLLGQKAGRSGVMAQAAALLADKPPSSDPQALDYYYWYHGTVALKKHGGQPWTQWQKPLRTVVLPLQRKDGNFAGSWDPVDVWGEDGGRIVATALLCLTLQAAFLDAPGK
ncbi:MAG: hypothetical protein WBO45_16590, partial [Planctomycetota bacterium]